ncbi:MAG: hypothetical protein Q9174_004010 [Haloplaca sp. 1 TL-2023]
MSPAVNSPYSFKMGDRSRRTSPKPKPPTTSNTPTASSPSVQDFMKAFSEYTQSVVDIALVQNRCDTLSQDERRQKEEHDRWSKYHGSFAAIGEDHTRTLEATQRAKQQSEQTLSQAKQNGEQAMKIIADSMLAASSGRLPVVVNDAASKTEARKQREEIADLWKEIDKLKMSNVKRKSDYHQLQDIAEEQKRHDKRIQELWKDSVQIPAFRDLEADVERTTKKLNNVSSASNTATKNVSALTDQTNRLTNLTSKQEAIIKDVTNKLDARKPNSSTSQMKTLEDEVDKTRESLKVIEAAHEKFNSESSIRNTEIQSLQRFKTEADSTLKDTAQRLEKLSQICNSIPKEPQVSKNQLSKLEMQLRSHEKKLATQAAALEKSESKDTKDTAKLRKDIDDARNGLETFQKFINSCTEEFQKVRTEQSSMAARIDEVELKHSKPSDEASKDARTPPSVDMIANQSGVSLRDLEGKIQANLDKIEQLQKDEGGRDEMVSQDLDDLHNLYIKQKAACEEQFKTQKGSIDQLFTDRASVSASMSQIKAEMDSLNGITNSLSRDRDAQQPFWDQLSTLQKQFQEFQKPIQAQPVQTQQPQAQLSPLESPPVKDELQPKIEGLTDKVKAMESILATQESRWNNLTTEPMVSNVVYRMRQLYPSLQHIQNDIGQIKAMHDQHVNEYKEWTQAVQRTHDEDGKTMNFVRNMAHAAVSAHEEFKRRTTTDIQNMQQRLVSLETQFGPSIQSTMDALASLHAEVLRKFSDEGAVRQQDSAGLRESFSTLKQYVTSQTEDRFQQHDGRITALSETLDASKNNLKNHADSKDLDTLRMKINVVQDQVNEVLTLKGKLESDADANANDLVTLRKKVSVVQDNVKDILAVRGELESLKRIVEKLGDRKSPELPDATLDKIAKKVVKRMPERVTTPTTDSRSSTPKNDSQALLPSNPNVKELRTSIHALAKRVDNVGQNMETRTDEFYQAQKELRTTTDDHKCTLQSLLKMDISLQKKVEEVKGNVEEVKGVLKEEIIVFEDRIKKMESRVSSVVKKEKDSGDSDDENGEVDETQEHFVSAPEDDDDSSANESDSDDESLISVKKGKQDDSGSDSEDEPIIKHRRTKSSAHQPSSPILGGGKDNQTPTSIKGTGNNKSNKARKRSRREISSSESYSEGPTPTKKNANRGDVGSVKPPKKRGGARPGSGRPKKG